MKNYDYLFVQEEILNAAIEDKIVKNLQEARYIMGAIGATELYALEQSIKSIIYLFSLKTTSKSRLENAINLFNISSKTIRNANCEIKLVSNPIAAASYNEIGETREIYELAIKMGEKTYTVGKMTDCFYTLENIMPEIETIDRKDNCHFLSVKLADILAKQGADLDVVTGYVYNLTDRTKFLHTWLESKKGTVFDSTLNAFINKELYQRLQHYEEVSRFSGKTIVQEFKELSDRIDTPDEQIDIKEFLVFGSSLKEATDPLFKPNTNCERKNESRHL